MGARQPAPLQGTHRVKGGITHPGQYVIDHRPAGGRLKAYAKKAMVETLARINRSTPSVWRAEVNRACHTAECRAVVRFLAKSQTIDERIIAPAP